MRTKRMLVHGVCLVVMVAFCLLPGLSNAQLDVTEWADLPEKVAAKMISADELGVTDCPAALQEASANRVVMQYIMNTFYKWYEYDLGTVNGKPQFCVVMELPLQKRLSREEAQTLLTASELWKEAKPPDTDEAVVLSPSDPKLQIPPREKFLTDPSKLSTLPLSGEDSVAVPPAKAPTDAQPVVTGPRLESVIGTDTRVRVTGTTVYPWNTVCYLGITFPGGGSFRGSGALVGPYCVLTAGHMVFDDGTNQWVNYTLIAPGQRQDTPTGTVIRPYGTRTAATWMSNTGYTGGGGFDYDYGAALFSTPFSGLSTYMPIQFDLLPGYINLAGYPPAVLTETNSQGMWWSANSVVGFTARILRYVADTSGGNSGGPVWMYNASTNVRRQCAVHVFGSTYYNGGCRLVAANQGAVQAFMNWRPATPPAAPTNVQASDGTYSDRVQVSWNAVSGATSYKIYRNTTSNSATASYRGTVSGLTYTDIYVEPGTIYYYWVKAVKGGLDSVFSIPNTGYRLRLYTTLTINAAGVYGGNIAPMGDADWYKFTVTTAGTYVIQTWAGTLTDNYMWLYGPNSATALIASNDDGGPGLMANLTRYLTAGTYYIKIKPYYSSVTGTYYIRVESVPTTPASLTVNGQTATVTLNFSGDTDTYKFVVTAAGTHTITTTAGTLSDNFMFLYGPNSQTVLLQSDDDGGTGYMARISRSLAVGTYYVRLISYYGSGAGSSGTFTARVTRP